MTQVIAHRGASGLEPENTVAAFRRAVALGADGVELDVRRSADGVLVVHHDARLADGRAIVTVPEAELPTRCRPSTRRSTPAPASSSTSRSRTIPPSRTSIPTTRSPNG